jgi:hypothetical protein
MACILIGSRSVWVGAPLAPRHELDAAGACLPRATCRPCMTSMRAIRVRFESYLGISPSSWCCLWGAHTDRTRGPCNRPIASSLPHRQSMAPAVALMSGLRGSSSSRFSKNLLPYLSMPIKVPALVSPAMRQHCCLADIDGQFAYQYAISQEDIVSVVSASGHGRYG